MKLKQLTSADIKELAKLVQEKEALQRKVSEIEQKIQNLWKVGSKVPGKRGVRTQITEKKRGPEKGTIPGRLKSSIIEALKNSGSEGLTVKELSQQLGVKVNNLYCWFYTTGKKTPGIIKLSKGHYGFDESRVEREKTKEKPLENEPLKNDQ